MTADEEHAYNRIARLHRMIERSLFWKDPPLDYKRTTRAFELLATLVHEYEWDSERLWYIGENGCCYLSDLLPGAYWFFSEYHSGMWSDEYRTQCVIGNVFDPGMSYLEEDSSEAAVYTALEAISGFTVES